jgi:hypothetical protein
MQLPLGYKVLKNCELFLTQNFIFTITWIMNFYEVSKVLEPYWCYNIFFSSVDRLFLLYLALVGSKPEYSSVACNTLTSTDASESERV